MKNSLILSTSFLLSIMLPHYYGSSTYTKYDWSHCCFNYSPLLLFTPASTIVTLLCVIFQQLKLIFFNLLSILLRKITGIPKYHQITPIMVSLSFRCLTINQRCQGKVFSLIHKSLKMVILLIFTPISHSQLIVLLACIESLIVLLSLCHFWSKDFKQTIV